MKPYDIIQAKKLPRQYDRRVKLLDSDKEHITALYRSGMGVRAIAREYEAKCSRRLIQFVLFPERLKAMQEKHAKEKHWKTFFNRKKLTEAVNNLRHYKKELNKKGLI
jgi:hypothetical protein